MVAFMEKIVSSLDTKEKEKGFQQQAISKMENIFDQKRRREGMWENSLEYLITNYLDLGSLWRSNR